MPLIILMLAILALVFGPQYWVKSTLRKYGKDRPDLQGTGSELAEHLIERYHLEGVSVREGQEGEDYYDPEGKVVSLSASHFRGKTVAAVAVATHEVSHALQHQEQNPGFMRRQRRIKTAIMIERFSVLALMVTPFIFLLTRLPQSTLITLLLGASGMVAALWVQLMNLPVEMDASFNKALPILEDGYLSSQDMPGARKVLKAAAMTYVAAALASLLNIGRWIAILRR
ncbi:zinc metallopeptidase [uncultured Endozoicomonas sp.]|uniref:zinc metallopeptidase n=1 Tax=uncultured Endozoicomonas sp. TaxID=432652 RepID=UPI002608964D|nr:zinc metallopeptidase [uncultured Endozoicomonas sp.]